MLVVLCAASGANAAASINQCGHTDWSTQGSCEDSALVVVRKFESAANSSYAEEPCCSDKPSQFRCRTGMELTDLSQADRYQLVVENPILFSSQPSFRPTDLKLNTMFLSLKEEAAGASKLVLIYNNSMGVKEVVASYEIFVHAGHLQ